MSAPRYERVAEQDDEDLPITSDELHQQQRIPSSPPPSFRSRRSSFQHGAADSEAERSLADAFDTPSDDDDEPGESRQLNGGAPGAQRGARDVQRRVTEIPTFTPSAARSGRVYGGGSGTNDGVFANISAKPIIGEEVDEKPPTYEQSQQDPAPPYWDTTVLTPGGFNSDDVFVDGLLVGSMFSFVWNALISMSFQLIGFLLTYLLHTTHAAKHGSRAGLGITLIQYGFTMRTVPSPEPAQPGAGDGVGAVPADPNAHDFDPNAVAGDNTAAAGMAGITAGINTSDWLSYVLLIVGWFILIRAVSDFIRARRQEALVRASPDRGLGVPVIASGEGENAV